MARIDRIEQLSREIDEANKLLTQVEWGEITIINKNESGITMSEESGMVIVDKENTVRFQQGLKHMVAALQQVWDLL